MTTLTMHEEYCREHPDDRTAMLALIDHHADALGVSMETARAACRALRRKWRRERELVEAAKVFADDGALAQDIRIRACRIARLPANAGYTQMVVEGEGPPKLTLGVRMHHMVTGRVCFTVTLYAHWVLVERDRLQAQYDGCKKKVAARKRRRN